MVSNYVSPKPFLNYPDISPSPFVMKNVFESPNVLPLPFRNGLTNPNQLFGTKPMFPWDMRSPMPTNIFAAATASGSDSNNRSVPSNSLIHGSPAPPTFK